MMDARSQSSLSLQSNRPRISLFVRRTVRVATLSSPCERRPEACKLSAKVVRLCRPPESVAIDQRTLIAQRVALAFFRCQRGPFVCRSASIRRQKSAKSERERERERAIEKEKGPSNSWLRVTTTSDKVERDGRPLEARKQTGRKWAICLVGRNSSCAPSTLSSGGGGGPNGATRAGRQSAALASGCRAQVLAARREPALAPTVGGICARAPNRAVERRPLAWPANQMPHLLSLARSLPLGGNRFFPPRSWARLEPGASQRDLGARARAHDGWDRNCVGAAHLSARAA